MQSLSGKRIPKGREQTVDKAETISKKWIIILYAASLMASLFLPKAEEGSISGFPFPVPMIFSVSEACPAAASAPGFSVSPITDEIASRIYGVSYPPDCTVPMDSLCYLTVLHVGFDGLTHTGELIAHEQIADRLLEIFYRLYQAGYPIEKMVLIDTYNADDEASMADNNTSAFCYRFVAGTDILSAHSYGLAVDINPLYNPWVSEETVLPADSPYRGGQDGETSPYFMTDQDYCVRLFLSYGFTWGGSWASPKDYQHFEYANSV